MGNRQKLFASEGGVSESRWSPDAMWSLGSPWLHTNGAGGRVGPLRRTGNPSLGGWPAISPRKFLPLLIIILLLIAGSLPVLVLRTFFIIGLLLTVALVLLLLAVVLFAVEDVDDILE